MSSHEKKRQGDHKFRYEVMAKKNELKELSFEESIFLSNSLCTENHNFLYKCCQLKNSKRIYACWFFNNAINVLLMDKGPIFKIFHESNLEELLCINVDHLLNTSSSYVFFFYFLVLTLGQCFY